MVFSILQVACGWHISYHVKTGNVFGFGLLHLGGLVKGYGWGRLLVLILYSSNSQVADFNALHGSDIYIISCYPTIVLPDYDHTALSTQTGPPHHFHQSPPFPHQSPQHLLFPPSCMASSCESKGLAVAHHQSATRTP
jgi:hypothetical protein